MKHEELIRRIGTEAMLKLVEEFGGVALYIPQKVKAQHPITLCIGLEAAKELASYYGGDYLYLPTGRKLMQVDQRKKIHELRFERMPISRIAREVGCSERWVRIVLSKYDKPQEETPLARLFGEAG